jgi:hypothetical protein
VDVVELASAVDVGCALPGRGEDGRDVMGESVPSTVGDSGRPLARASLFFEVKDCFWAFGVDGFCELVFLARADAELADNGGMSESRKGLPTMTNAGEGAADIGFPDAQEAVFGSADDSASALLKKSDRFGGCVMPKEAGLTLFSVSLAA